MVSDAEAHAEEDKLFREMVGARNKADASAHTVEKAIKDLGDKLSDEEKKPAQEALDAVKAAMAGDDREDLERKTEALVQASAAILQKTYEKDAATAGGAGADGSAEKKDDVLDAEFEEVKDGDRKKA
jgi:molecular chaperone DnaK